VRDGKAHIIKSRCIDCGECIRACPERAKTAIVDPLSAMEDFDYTIALPAPALYGQFSGLKDASLVLEGLRRMGFDQAFEVAAAAERVSALIAEYLRRPDIPRPAISSACPAIVRLISLRFPSLVSHVIPIYSPMQYAALWAKRLAARETGLPAERIGAFFISPCPAKVRAVRHSVTSRNDVDGVFSIRDVYPKLLPHVMGLIKRPPEERIRCAGAAGIGWCSAGGEASAVDNPHFVAADGIDGSIRLLEDIEDGRLPDDVEFVELGACSGGCVGGVLTVESPFVAHSRVVSLMRAAREAQLPAVPIPDPPAEAFWDSPLSANTEVLQLDSDIGKAIAKRRELERIEASLYGMDCGACGAPTCRALAEDIVRGFATEDLCIYRIKERLQALIEAQAVAAEPETL
jgi:ferredoxin